MKIEEKPDPPSDTIFSEIKTEDKKPKV